MSAPRVTHRSPRYSPVLTAAAIACGGAAAVLSTPPGADWLSTWREIGDAFCSLAIVLFVGSLAALWILAALVRILILRRDSPVMLGSRPAPPARRLPLFWAIALLAICMLELLTHAGERNGWVASSRPTAGVERWTTADGYTSLMDGIPAQGDGAFLLPMLGVFVGDNPPSDSDFDRRAGHVYLVSLLTRALGTYWSFAAVNLLCWWVAAMLVWWLGARRWPGTAVPWVASLLVATGQGFIFMAAAPQAHAPAFAGFVFALALCDALDVWRPDAPLLSWAKVGWATGAAGLIYLVHIPFLLFLWLYGLGVVRLRHLLMASAVTLAIVYAWQGYASFFLGLHFAGANNELTSEALANWRTIASGGLVRLIGQLHVGSIRGLLAAAFYYPWWLLAGLGLLASGRESRRWSLAIIVAVAIPAIGFSPRFTLPRVAYFMYPAVYLLAARGIEVLGTGLASFAHRALRPPAAATPANAQLAAMALATALLVLLANADVIGIQQFDLWFHYSQGNAW